MSIGAAWLILIVLFLRLLLRQAPKWVNCVLWGLQPYDLVCPYVPETVQPDAGSLPDAESLRQCGDLDACTDTGHQMGNPTQNVIEGAGAAGLTGILTGAGTVATGFWRRTVPADSVCGKHSMVDRCARNAWYAVYSYLRVRRQVSEAIWLRDNLLDLRSGEVSVYSGAVPT